METILVKSSGLQTAWLLATLGSKATTKRNIRKDILDISIPEVCDQLQTKCNAAGIRYSSNMLYGISLMYKSKLDYFLGDLSLVKTRLSQELSLKRFGSTNSVIDHTEVLRDQLLLDTKPGALLLQDDPAFSISIDFVSDFTIDIEAARRKQDIQKLDEQIFPNPPGTRTAQKDYSGFMDTEDHQRISRYLDQDLSLDSFKFDETDSSQVDFAFNDSGNVVNMSSQDSALEVEDANDGFNLNYISELPLQEIGVEGDEHFDTGRSITNDTNFHLSNTENQISYDQLTTIKRKRTYQSLVVDSDQLTLSTSEMRKCIKKYKMIISTNWPDPVDAFHYSDILQHTITTTSSLPKVVLAGFMTGLNIPENMHPISKAHGIDKAFHNVGFTDNEFEVARDFQGSPQLHINHSDQEIVSDDFDESHGNTVTEDSIFGLSFSEINRGESAGDLITRHVDDPDTESATRLVDKNNHETNSQLEEFYSFLQERINTHGAERFDEEHKGRTAYRSIQFNVLIPNSSNQVGGTCISRKLAANSFASILALATKNMIGLKQCSPELGPALGKDIEIYTEMEFGRLLQNEASTA